MGLRVTVAIDERVGQPRTATSSATCRPAPPDFRRTKRPIKSPKLYWGDVGLALHLSGDTEPTGPHLENLVQAAKLTLDPLEPSDTCSNGVL